MPLSIDRGSLIRKMSGRGEFSLYQSDPVPRPNSARTQSKHAFMVIDATVKINGRLNANKLKPFALCRRRLIDASRRTHAQPQIFLATA